MQQRAAMRVNVVLNARRAGLIPTSHSRDVGGKFMVDRLVDLQFRNYYLYQYNVKELFISMCRREW